MFSKIHHRAKLGWVRFLSPLAGGWCKDVLGHTASPHGRAESGSPAVIPVMSGAGMCGSLLQSWSFWWLNYSVYLALATTCWRLLFCIFSPPRDSAASGLLLPLLYSALSGVFCLLWLSASHSQRPKKSLSPVQSITCPLWVALPCHTSSGPWPGCGLTAQALTCPSSSPTCGQNGSGVRRSACSSWGAPQEGDSGVTNILIPPRMGQSNWKRPRPSCLGNYLWSSLPYETSAGVLCLTEAGVGFPLFQRVEFLCRRA